MAQKIIPWDALKIPVPPQKVEQKIYLIRNQKVMLDTDLAELYGVKTFRLNEQVKRNAKRFPGDFMFRLAPEEVAILRSQFAISSLKHGGRRSTPYVFTEQGVAMLSSVLNSERAVQVNIVIIRTFVRLRELMTTHKDLARKIHELEKKYDSQFQVVFDAIRQLIEPASPQPKRRIGFNAQPSEV